MRKTPRPANILFIEVKYDMPLSALVPPFYEYRRCNMLYFLHLPQSVPGGTKVNTSIGLFSSSSTSDPVRRSLFTAATSLNSTFTSTPGRTASSSDSSAAPLRTVDVPKISTPSTLVCTDGGTTVSASTSAADASYTFGVDGSTVIGGSTVRIFSVCPVIVTVDLTPSMISYHLKLRNSLLVGKHMGVNHFVLIMDLWTSWRISRSLMTVEFNGTRCLI